MLRGPVGMSAAILLKSLSLLVTKLHSSEIVDNVAAPFALHAKVCVVSLLIILPAH